MDAHRGGLMRTLLLTIDATVNLALGALLLVFPRPVVAFLGVPPSPVAFYPSILGAVLIGIGGALLVERRNPTGGARGLGLVGALIINLCGGGALAAWLLVGRLGLSTRGSVVLWLVAAVVVGLSGIELLAERRRGTPPRPR
jgi:hypothetical protein